MDNRREGSIQLLLFFFFFCRCCGFSFWICWCREPVNTCGSCIGRFRFCCCSPCEPHQQGMSVLTSRVFDSLRKQTWWGIGNGRCGFGLTAGILFRFRFFVPPVVKEASALLCFLCRLLLQLPVVSECQGKAP